MHSPAPTRTADEAAADFLDALDIAADKGLITDTDPAGFRNADQKLTHIAELYRILHKLHTIVSDWEDDTINPCGRRT